MPALILAIVFVIIIAAIVTVIELSMNAYLHELYKVMGIFIALIVTNCSVLARAEAFASHMRTDFGKWEKIAADLALAH